MKSSTTYSIGELAGRFGLATHVLRHWEDEGLIEPAERVNGRRRYDESHVARVTMILRGKQLGMSLAQIGELLASDHEEHPELLRRHRAGLDAQLRRIAAMRAMIDHALDCHERDFTRCHEFQDVARAAAPEPSLRPG